MHFGFDDDPLRWRRVHQPSTAMVASRIADAVIPDLPKVWCIIVIYAWGFCRFAVQGVYMGESKT